MNFNGWYPRRRGVLEHVRDGRMSLLDLAFHDVLCQLADAGTGIAPNAAAWYLAREMGISRKLAQKYLIRLESKRYIRRIRKSRSHATQPTLIHQYLCTDFPHKGRVLNAWSGEDYAQCEYVPVSREVSREVSRGETYPLNKEFKNLRSKETTAQNPRGAPPPPGKDESEHQRRQQAKQRRQQLEAIGVPRTQEDRARGKENAIEERRRAEANAIDDAIERERAAQAGAKHTEKPAEVATEVSTAADPAAQPIARARDIGIAAAAAAGAGPVDRAVPQAPTPITRARESTSASGSGLQGGAREKPGPQPIETMTKAEIDAELRALKAKLASVGNMR